MRGLVLSENFGICPWCFKGRRYFCQITAVKRNFAEAKLLTVNKASKNRVKPACSVYETCGGCQIMHLAYPKQLDFKDDVIRQALKSSNQLVMNNLRLDRL